MASSAPVSNSSIYTNYVNVHFSIDKLDGTKLGLRILNYGLKVKDMLIILPSVVLMLMKSRWLKIDAQLCIVIKSTIYSS